MNKGELWVVDLSYKTGREQKGTRPALVLANTKTELIIVIPLTSNLQALRFPNTIEIKSSEQNGLRQDSIALLFQLQAIDQRRLLNKIGLLENSYLSEIDNKLKNMLKL